MFDCHAGMPGSAVIAAVMIPLWRPQMIWEVLVKLCCRSQVQPESSRVILGAQPTASQSLLGPRDDPALPRRQRLIAWFPERWGSGCPAAACERGVEIAA